MRFLVALALGSGVGAAAGALGSKRRGLGAAVGAAAGAAAFGALWKLRPVDLPENLISMSALDPSAAAVFLRVQEIAAREGYRIRYHSGRRTCAEQDKLFAQGRTAPGAIVTNARGCQSWHVLGRAVDFDFVKGERDRDYRRIGQIAESFGCVWGGRFDVGGSPDLGHLEYHPGMTIEQACPDPNACGLLTS